MPGHGLVMRCNRGVEVPGYAWIYACMVPGRIPGLVPGPQSTRNSVHVNPRTS